MIRLLAAAWLCWLALTSPVLAATDVVHVYFLPLQEAAGAVRSQLSETGKVAAIASQRILIIDDDAAHIRKAKALLKRIDHAPGQYTAYVSIEDIHSDSRNDADVTGNLAGGWLRLQLQHQQIHANHRQSFQLRVSSQQAGSIETGTIHSVSRATRLWLSGYGVVRAQGVEQIPVTSGFHITVSAAGVDQVRVRIVPWMQRLRSRVQGRQEMLIDLGNSNAPAIPAPNTANIRLNAQAVIGNAPVIELIGAATELIIPVDQSVTIAAVNREAEKLGGALLSRFSHVGKRQFIMHLRVAKN